MLASAGNKLLKLYRIQKGIDPRSPLDVAMEDSEQGEPTQRAAQRQPDG